MPGIAWKRWNWVEWGIVPLASTMMIAAWSSPLLQFILGLNIVQPRGLGYPAWLVVALLLGASVTKSLLPKTSFGRAISGLIGLVAILAVLIGFSPYRDPGPVASLEWVERTIRSLAEWQEGIPGPFLLAIMSAVLWARGLAADWTAHDELWRAFVLGVLVLGLLILLSGRGGTMQAMALERTVVSFLLTGLLALALLAALDILTTEQTLGKRTANLNRYWLSALFLAVLATMIFGWLLGQVFAPDAVARFIRSFDPLRRFIGQVLSLVLTVIAYVIFVLVMAIYKWVSRWIGKPETDTAQFARATEDLARQAEQSTRSLQLSPDLKLILVLLFLFLFALTLFWLVWRHKHRRASNDQVVEERQSIGGKDLLLDQLGKLFRRSPQADPFLDLSSLVGPRRVIRLLYQSVLSAARSVGHPRLPGQTPYTYEDRLARVLPDEKPDLRTLTEAYVEARYSEQELASDAVTRTRVAAARIEHALRQNRRHS